MRAIISDRDPLTWTFNPKVTLLRLSTIMFLKETVSYHVSLTFLYCSQYVLFTFQNFAPELFSLPGYYPGCVYVCWGGGGGYSPKFYTGRLHPEVQPLTLIIYYMYFWQKRYPLYHMHCLELFTLLTVVFYIHQTFNTSVSPFGPFYRPKWQISLSFHILQLV